MESKTPVAKQPCNNKSGFEVKAKKLKAVGQFKRKTTLKQPAPLVEYNFIKTNIYVVTVLLLSQNLSLELKNNITYSCRAKGSFTNYVTQLEWIGGLRRRY